MKIEYGVIFFMLITSFAGCKESGKEEKPQEQNDLVKDSLAVENAQLNSFIDTIAISMDSISEGYIFKDDTLVIPTSSREQIKQNLSLLEDLLKRQKERIAELERSVVAERKRRQAELEKKNENIADLKQHLSEQNSDIEGLSQKAQEQETALTAQTDIINEGYVKVGSKKELKAAGLISGSGLFSKKELNVANMDESQFQKVDMRQFESLRINGKKPKVLTHMPASSYKIEDNGDGTATLRVLDPTTFWSVSSYLIIQSN